ncbi:MAG: EF-hand domain-containing protein [Stigonema ocellatum SAG 48.90 = DSM 106950]|nr:EF-hand domain-containing protein [Stigonema ocellatum SAG 48.90 = DSM 106950]
MNEFQTRKLKHRFALLDIDNNGYITTEDYHKVPRKILAAFGEPATSERGVRLLGVFMNWWEALRVAADTSGDDRVSPEEFFAALGKGVPNAEVFQSTGGPVLNAIVDIAANGGDQVSKEAFGKWFVAMGVPAQEANDSFDRLDQDGQGYLTRERLNSAMTEFYTSDDPNSPGNLLWGRF